MTVAAAFVTAGCSVAFVQGPPPVAERRPGFECTTSPAAPIVDLSLAVLSLLLTTGAASNSSSSFDRDPGLRAVTVGSGTLVAGLTIVSGVVGLDRISDCELAKSQVLPEPSLRVERRPTPSAPAPTAVQGALPASPPAGAPAP